MRQPNWRTLRQSQLVSCIPIFVSLALCLLTCFASWRIHQADVNRLHATFTARTQNVFNGLKENLLFLEQAVQAMANLFRVHQDVSREQFAAAAARQAPDFLGIQALEWIPAVPRDQRRAHEDEAREEGFQGFGFRRWNNENGWEHNSEDWADEYFPVFFVHPMHGNEQAFGIDLGSHPERRQALMHARATGQPIATGGITLAQEKEQQTGVLIFVPVRDEGFALGVVRIGDVVESVLASRDVAGIELRITDESAQDAGQKLLYQSSAYAPEPDFQWHKSYVHEIGGRQWNLFWSYRPEYVASEYKRDAWYVLLSGFCLSGLVGLVLWQRVRKQAEVEQLVTQRTQELRDAQAALLLNQFATDNASDAVFLIRQDGTFSYVNHQATEYLRYSQEELLRMSVSDIDPEFSRNAWQEHWENAKQSRVLSFESIHQRKDGSRYDCHVKRHFLEFGTTESIHAIVRDITADKELLRKVEASEEQMRLTFESSPSGLVLVDESGKITAVNPSMTSIFGYSREDMLGQPVEMLVPERCRNQHITDRRNYLASPETRPMGTGMDLFGLRHDGTEFPVEIGLTPLGGAAANSTMATVIDYSERKRYERSIKNKNEQLGRLNTELLEFAYSASHDLKAPLASIAGLLAFCEHDLTEGDLDEVSANIEKAKKLAERLAIRVESTLTLAKTDMESGQWEAIAVEPRVNDAWNSMPHSGVTLETSYTHKDPILSVPARFDAILDNLISNAIKYQDQDKQDKLVSIRTRSQGDSFFLVVEDNGVGIDADQKEKVFRLFHRLAADDTTGTGLGLPLIKKNVARLGGTIDLDSRKGRTRFTVVLPQVVEESPPTEET